MTEHNGCEGVMSQGRNSVLGLEGRNESGLVKPLLQLREESFISRREYIVEIEALLLEAI